MSLLLDFATGILTTVKMGALGAIQAQTPGTQQDPRAQLLAQMHDVKTPEAVSWWPPAPGWIILGIILFILIAYGFYRAYCHFLKRRYRKSALTALSEIRDALYHAKTISSHDAMRQSMQIVKRCFFTAYPGSRRYIAGLEGTAWIQLLKETSASPIPEQNIAQEIQRALYHPNQNAIDNETVFIFCELWIKEHREHSKQLQSLIEEYAVKHLGFRPQESLGGAYV